MNALLFLQVHAGEIVAALTALVTFCSAIANLTPSDHDNKIVASVGKAVNFLALNFKK